MAEFMNYMVKKEIRSNILSIDFIAVIAILLMKQQAPKMVVICFSYMCRQKMEVSHTNSSLQMLRMSPILRISLNFYLISKKNVGIEVNVLVWMLLSIELMGCSSFRAARLG